MGNSVDDLNLPYAGNDRQNGGTREVEERVTLAPDRETYAGEYAWKFGRHTGIPDCCIEWWTTVWWHYLPDEMEARNRRVKLILGKNPGYIPCPTCLEQLNIIKPHWCGRECLEWMINDLGLDPVVSFDSIMSNMMYGKVPAPNGRRIVKVLTLPWS